ncbi:MAG TPA: GTPase ObgE [Candidatus Saccharimonadales bacterium]|nr:GTPase ObgE [Candidatus Saccharimonadales bacterium]
MFVDKVLVHVKAGNGGDGAVSFRHEKFVDKGGPDGGDGGRGGSVIFVADQNENTLVHFRYKQELQAQHGVAGFHRQQRGKGGEDLFVKVPVGTQVYEDGELIADLVTLGQQAVIARGGDGGFGNAHFKSSVRQVPRVAEVGERGEDKELTLELKLLADVGLVGFPNAGKSTFLSVVSNARPEIADYPFTTLTPNLGVADIDDTSLLIADIPGLIEGASTGKGLGDAFLRHVERTQVLIHLIDIYEKDVAQAFTTIQGELVAYSKKLAKRPQVVALTKIEGLPQDGIDQQLERLKAAVPKGTKVVAISSQAHIGVTELLREVQKLVAAARKKVEKQKEEDGGLPVIGLDPNAEALAWRVQRKDGQFVITGTKIEKFAGRTNFTSEPGVRRLRDIMKRMGIVHELERQGAQPGDTIVIGKHGGHHLPHQP